MLGGRRQGVQPGVVPQPGEEVDPRRAVLGQDQRPDDALQGEAAVEDGQMRPATIRACSRSSSTASSHLVRNSTVPSAPGRRQLRLAEVEPAGDGQEPGGLAGFVEQGPRTTQLWARTVVARLGQRAVYSWKVQVPQTWGLLRWTLVSSPAQTR